MVIEKSKDKFKEIYISTDVETDGPIPGEYSMLSLGSVAFAPSGRILGKFYKKLKPLKKAKKHPDTMKFWKENPNDYKEATINSESSGKVMDNYLTWLEKLKKKTINNNYDEVIFLGWPLAFDYLFTYWYLVKFAKKIKGMNPLRIPFSFNKSIDFHSFFMGHLKKSFIEARPWKSLPKEDIDKIVKRKTHKAVDDALIQGKIFIKILKSNHKK